MATLASLTLAALGAPGCGGGSDSGPVPPATIRLTAGGALPPNASIASVALVNGSAGVALVSNSSGAGPRPETLFAFNPLSGAVAATASAQAVVTTGTALPDENGNLLTSWTTSFPAFAAAAGGKLYVTTNNTEPPVFAFQPGSVLVYDYDAASGALGAMRTPLITAHGGEVYYNPTWIGAFRRASGGDRLAVVCSGTYGFGASVTAEAAVLVIDPATDAIVESVTFAARTVSAGEATISDDLRLYVGGSGFSGAADSCVYVIDLSTSPPTVRHGEASPIALPTSSTFQSVTDLALSADQKTLYAANYNDGAVHILSRTGAGSADTPAHVTRVAAMKRGATGANADAQNDAQSLVVRPGFPDLSYDGPDLAVGTVNITAAGDQAVANVQTAVDVIDTRHGAPATGLDALVAPFQVFDDIQSMAALQVGSRKQYLYIAQNKSGDLVVVDWDTLR